MRILFRDTEESTDELKDINMILVN